MQKVFEALTVPKLFEIIIFVQPICIQTVCIQTGTGCPILAPKAAYGSTELQILMQNAKNPSIAKKYSFCCFSLALCVLWFCTQLTWKSGGTSKRSTGIHPDDRLIHTHNTREAGSPVTLQYIRDPETSF